MRHIAAIAASLTILSARGARAVVAEVPALHQTMALTSSMIGAGFNVDVKELKLPQAAALDSSLAYISALEREMPIPLEAMSAKTIAGLHISKAAVLRAVSGSQADFAAFSRYAGQGAEERLTLLRSAVQSDPEAKRRFANAYDVLSKAHAIDPRQLSAIFDHAAARP